MDVLKTSTRTEQIRFTSVEAEKVGLAFMRTECLFVSVLIVASGPRVKLASCKSALNPPVVYSTDRSKAVVPVLVLLLVALWFILRGDLLYVFPCVILFLFFSPFSIAITSLGKERANLSAFRAFVRFVLVWICWFPLSCGTPWTFLLSYLGSRVASLSRPLIYYWSLLLWYFLLTVL